MSPVSSVTVNSPSPSAPTSPCVSLLCPTCNDTQCGHCVPAILLHWGLYCYVVISIHCIVFLVFPSIQPCNGYYPFNRYSYRDLSQIKLTVMVNMKPIGCFPPKMKWPTSDICCWKSNADVSTSRASSYCCSALLSFQHMLLADGGEDKEPIRCLPQKTKSQFSLVRGYIHNKCKLCQFSSAANDKQWMV